jgi:hypothetical protein
MTYRKAICLGALLAVLVGVCVAAKSYEEQSKMDFCAVVASPAGYDGKTFSADVILWPSEHSVSLFGSACRPREGDDVTTQAVLPPAWESLPYGKKLRSFLKRHRSAKVELVGTFSSDGERYGPDAARFRFSIVRLISVSADGG